MACAVVLAAHAALAYPEGAPWGSANPDATESCSSCHYDYAPQRESAALTIEGLPRCVTPAQNYELVIRFAAANAAVAGFQLLAAAGDADAGVFRSADPAIETIAAASRSTAAATIEGDVTWRLTWRSPDAARPIVLYLAASAANDDQSPLGDTIHYRSFALAPAETD